MVDIWYPVQYVINRCGTTNMREIWYIYRGLVTILLWSYYSADVYSIARAYAHLERYRRLQSIWYCCWYSMIKYYDLCYRFLVSLKPPTRCNIISCMMSTTNHISADVYIYNTRLILHYREHQYLPPNPTIDKNNICNGIRWFVGWRYGIIFDLDCNNKK